MKKLHGGALVTLVVSVVTMLTLTGCPDNNSRNQGYNGYYNDGYYYGYYPYSSRYMLMRADQQGRTEYVALDQPLNGPQDVARYEHANFRPMNNGQVIDQQRGYQNVRDNGFYFVAHNEQMYTNPYKSGQRQSSYWWNNYNYSCNMNYGYWRYNYYCNYSWNHIYSPYNYNWYNNWYWRPTYYYNNSFWYFAPAWNNYFQWNGYYYYYFWIPGYGATW